MRLPPTSGASRSRALVDKEAGNTQWQRDLSISLRKIGDIELQDGHPPAALAAYEEGLAIARRLAAQDHGNAQAQRDVLIGLNKLGDAKLRGGDTAGALAAYQESLDLARKLAALSQDDAQAQTDLVVGLFKVSRLVDPQQARALLIEAVAIVERLEQEHKLTEAQKDWPNLVRTTLSKLP